ncbi:hypothetical protein SY212_08430 [Ligilactobacillus agilis]|uniref:Uncharacterized protein n=1 Tax=Ligilactobacillus agilis TaxID=1601 RepID=A0A6F9XKL7_9LACO|nr:hypothetical protein SY212_08430 [Ligilactobacillus agilis]
MDKDKQLVALKRGFDELVYLFVALGAETRQHLIMTLFNLPCKQQGGARVGEITPEPAGRFASFENFALS